jgi:2-octaprenyl-6-methoxyphenol hydroxylase
MSREEAARRLNLPDAELGAELDAQTSGHLGGALPQGPRGFFPMAGMRAQKIAKPRIALTGEAAHVFPPLAAQGLNLSLRDVADLVDCLEDARAAGHDIGTMEVLSLYEKRHKSDIALRTNGVDLLNRSLLIDFLPLDYVRLAGFAAFSMFGPLRRSVLWEGLVPDGYQPRLMRPAAFNRHVKRDQVRANRNLEREFGTAAP